MYGVTMTMPENGKFFQQLSEGYKALKHHDNPPFNLKQIFQVIVLYFNIADAVIELPGDVFDMDGINNMDPNNQSRIRIERDCE